MSIVIGIVWSVYQMPLCPNLKGRGKPPGALRTMKEFALMKGLTEVQMRSLWTHTTAARPEPWLKCNGVSNKHYYLLSELEAWYAVDRKSKQSPRVGI